MIRKAEIDDAAIIAEFNSLMALETEGLQLDAETVLAGVKQAIDGNKATYYLYEKADKIVGQAMITREWSDWRNGFFWWLQSVYVHENYRRQGIFRSLYQYIKKLSEENEDICGIRLYVDINNKKAQSTYQMMGMQETDYKLYEWEKDS